MATAARLWPKWYDPAPHRSGIDLIERTAEVFGVTVPRLLNKDNAGKAQRYVFARAALAAELRRRGNSLYTIGRLLGKRHHTTVLHMLREVPEMHKDNPHWVLARELVQIAAGR